MKTFGARAIVARLPKQQSLSPSFIRQRLGKGIVPQKRGPKSLGPFGVPSVEKVEYNMPFLSTLDRFLEAVLWAKSR
jgi:hypothetical protein